MRPQSCRDRSPPIVSIQRAYETMARSTQQSNIFYSATAKARSLEDDSFEEDDDIEKDISFDPSGVDPSSNSTYHHRSSRARGNSSLESELEMTDIQTMSRRTRIFGFVVLFLGHIAGFLFVWFGSKNVTEESNESFDTRANELTLVVETTWSEYQRTAASAHEICSRRGNTTRLEFQEFYEYLLADGIEFQSIQCVPKVYHEDRTAHEAEAKVYWENRLPNFTYHGFTGIAFNPVSGIAELVAPPEPERPVYFPIKYCEPPVGNENAIDLDVYFDEVTFKPLLDLSIRTVEPVLSARIETVQETADRAYSVLVYHPGVPLTTQPGKVPDVFSSLVVRVPSLLERVARLQEEDLAVYLYDIRPDGRKEFLGAAEYDASFDNSQERSTVVSFPQEIDYDTLKALNDGERFHEEVIDIASGSWLVAVLPVDDTYDPDLRLVIFGGVMLIVASAGIAFWSYTNMRRVEEIYKAKTEAEAERAIVANLFPENVRNRMIEGAQAKNEAIKEEARLRKFGRPTGSRNTARESDPLTSEGLFGSKPIADFHPEATLMFADLQGFTAWSSTREPTQVFALLEVLYNAFDRIANRRRIFKVETVGDCYVASAGVPVARKDHAVAMARFAADCLRAMPLVVAKLEKSLGPDTGDLAIRIGLHSGAVTSGVLRGDKGRFQLFGDAMNSASRMESTGMAGKIHVSPQCADLLCLAGKGSWLEPRDVQVFVKGKGRLQTYWLIKDRGCGDVSQASSTEIIEGQSQDSLHDPLASREEHSKGRADRLVSWSVEEITRLLRLVVARRQATQEKLPVGSMHSNSRLVPVAKPIDEVKDVIAFPEFDSKAFENQVDPESVDLDPKVILQLTNLITRIAALYHKNPFHNFEHASHVALCVSKMLSRIVNPRELQRNRQYSDDTSAAIRLHDHTFGITSVPLTQFAAFFCALIHDVDHPGIPNIAFGKEKPDLAAVYKNISIAEQNSIDMSWALFMREEYKDLRDCICPTEAELVQFRQLIVQMVMATDVMDRGLGKLRKERWSKAFDNVCDSNQECVELRNRKGTIVLEHLIQASDVSHTMQHWHIYHKWNEKLFMEMYHAYKQGRLQNDPSQGWYQGEMEFFDFYVIPLAKKLDACGVFGVSSDEFLIYAKDNRKEWERRGQELVQDYLEKYSASFSSI